MEAPTIGLELLQDNQFRVKPVVKNASLIAIASLLIFILDCVDGKKRCFLPSAAPSGKPGAALQDRRFAVTELATHP